MGRPGGLAYVIGKNGEEPDMPFGACSDDEVSNSEDDEEVDLRQWMKDLEARKKDKSAGSSGGDGSSRRSHAGPGADASTSFV